MLTGLHLEEILQALGFAGARISAVLIFAPFFGGVAVPRQVKAGLVLTLTALLYPVYRPTLHGPIGFSAWSAGVLSEMLVGLLLGLTMQFIFDAVQIAGQVLGIQMGFSLVNIMDPQTQVDTPVLSILHQLATLLIFLQLNVHHWMLRGMARSFDYIPPGSAVASWGATNHLLQSAGGIWLSGVQIAAPVLLATMLADIALGFLGKASPQLPVLFIGLSIKSLLGCAVLICALPLWPRYMERHFLEAVSTSERLLQLAR